jgi:hypothetical protein
LSNGNEKNCHRAYWIVLPVYRASLLLLSVAKLQEFGRIAKELFV